MHKGEIIWTQFEFVNWKRVEMFLPLREIYSLQDLIKFIRIAPIGRKLQIFKVGKFRTNIVHKGEIMWTQFEFVNW